MSTTEPAEAEHDGLLEKLTAALRRDRLDPENSSGDPLLDMLAAKVGTSPNPAEVTTQQPATAALNDLGPVLRAQGFNPSNERDIA